MIIKTLPNSIVRKYFSQKADNFNPVLKSISQFYHLIGSSVPTWETPSGVYFPSKASYIPPTKKRVRFYVGTLTNDPTSPFIWSGTAWSAYSSEFNFEGVTYKSATTITGDNIYLQSTDFEAVKNSIITALTANGVLKLWDIVWSSPIRLGFYHVAINFDLIKKEEGDYTITSTMKKVESLLENIYVNTDVVTDQQTPIFPNYINMFNTPSGSLEPYWSILTGYFIDYTGLEFQAMLIENYSLSSNNELNSYEIGLDINDSSNNTISSISKKGTVLGDFNPLPIIHNELKSWKPTIGTFNLGVDKYADSFELSPFQYIINKSVSTLYRPKISDANTFKVTVIDAYKDLFKNYTPNKTLSTNHTYFDDYYNREVVYTFSEGTGLAGVNATCNVIKQSLDGGYFLGGKFTSYNSYPSVNIIKINSDGSVNTGFTSLFQYGPNAENINDIIEQPDGKIIIAGNFFMYGNYTISHITRLNADGTLDGTWINPSYTPTDNRLNGAVRSIALQGDGKVIAGGIFTTFNNSNDNKRIIRFNTDGTKDGTFDNSNGFDGDVNIVKLLNDGNILVGGDYTTYKAFNQNCLIRLLSTGLTDTTFDMNGVGISTATATSDVVYTISLNPNQDQYLVGGTFDLFTTASGTIAVAGLILLSSTTADIVPLSLFHTKNVNNIVESIYSDGGYLIAGGFAQYDGFTTGGFVKTDSIGNIISSFDTNTGVGGGIIVAIGIIDGGIVIGGNFTSYNGTNHNRIYVMDDYGDPYTIYYNLPELMTNQPSIKKIGQSYEILSCLNIKPIGEDVNVIDSNINDKVKIDITYFDGATFSYGTFSSNSKFSGANDVYINTFCFNVDDLISNLSSTQSVRFIDVKFLLSDEENFTYISSNTQRYYFDPNDTTCDTLDEELDITPIVFKNAEGAFDIFEMEEILEMKTDSKREEITSPFTYLNTELDSFSRVYSVMYNKVYSITSRILTDDEFAWLEEVGKCKEIYILKGSDLYPINIKSFEYMTKLNTDKKIALTFQFSKPEVTY